MSATKLPVYVCALFALLPCVATAAAETVNCIAVTALPAVITVQGVYCLAGDLSTAMTSGNAIEIQTNNVVLDLNGFKLGGLAAGPGTFAIGIKAVNRQNITIKNGTIRGFLEAIFLQDSGASQGHVVEDIRADQNTSVGIHVEGTRLIVRNNQVVRTGGTTIAGANADATGIFLVGNFPLVLNNDVINTFHQGTATAWGILFINGGFGGLAVNNRITQADRGIDYGTGTGEFRDNVTFDVPTPYLGGTNIGNNS